MDLRTAMEKLQTGNYVVVADDAAGTLHKIAFADIDTGAAGGKPVVRILDYKGVPVECFLDDLIWAGAM